MRSGCNILRTRNCTPFPKQAILAILMFIVAVVFSMLGQGGGVLYTPIQVWAGVELHIAATTSLFLIMIMSLSAFCSVFP